MTKGEGERQMTVCMLVVVRTHRRLEEMQGTMQLRAARWHAPNPAHIRQHTSEYVSIRPHTSAYFRIRQHTSAPNAIHSCLHNNKLHMQLLINAKFTNQYTLNADSTHTHTCAHTRAHALHTHTPPGDKQGSDFATFPPAAASALCVCARG